MIKLTNLFIAIVFIGALFQGLLAQEIKQENIAILPFGGWQGGNAEAYQNALTDKIATRIIQSHRFKVIDRANLEKIFQEQGLSQTGAIDEQTTIEVGKLLGANKFIVGSFTRNSTDYHEATYDKKGKKTADDYYTSDINATIKMLDVETGEYIEAVEAGGKGKGNNRNSAFFSAIDDAAGNIVNTFFKYFAIQAFIQSIDQSYAIIDRGTELGVQVGMNFEVLNMIKQEIQTGAKNDITSETRRIGMLRIVSAEKSTAKGRLIGDFSAVRSDHLIREVKEAVALEASIMEKHWGEVVINLGSEVGVKRGTTFKVILQGREFTDRTTGESYGFEEIKKGVICVTSVQEKFARAKILKGRYSIEQGMLLKEISRWKSGWNIGFSYSVAQVDGKANTIDTTVTVGNEYVNDFDMPIDYSGKEDIKTASIAKINVGYYDFVRDNDWQLGFGLISYQGEMNAFMFDLSFAHHFGIVPEFFYIYPGVGLGMGFAQQDAQSGLISKLSDHHSDDVSAIGFEWSGQFGARIALGKFNLFGELNYSGLAFTKWEYSVKTGEKETNDEGDKEDKTEDITIDDHLIPYPEVKIGGPAIKLGIAYVF